VGAASRNQSVLLKLSDAYKIRQDVNPDLLLGGVAIPERHMKKNISLLKPYIMLRLQRTFCPIITITPLRLDENTGIYEVAGGWLENDLMNCEDILNQSPYLMN